MLLCCLRCTLKPSASATVISKLYQHFRERDSPYGLQDSLPTLNPSCSLPILASNSAMGPRLDTGGWQTLTESHFWLSPDRDFHPARYAELCSARQRLSSPAAMKRQRNSGQVERFVMSFSYLPIDILKLSNCTLSLIFNINFFFIFFSM